ncbi:Apo protein chloroplastic-like [Thalictrum thalictroides]|uniref:Apo protein chloroplastic-like n=1 Tax=Thalictrum thalictroides TaxID=46969 RepID=A0A7J6VJ32_THATH|nr:Apo protein chloroplastic-like [Thalictrum thalictroides]
MAASLSFSSLFTTSSSNGGNFSGSHLSLNLYGCNELKCPLMFKDTPRVLSRPCFIVFVVKCNNPQNADLPRYYSKKEKKPFPVPILELRRAARERMKRLKGQPRKPVPPPRNGMLLKRLIPLAYEVFNARITLINNVKKLMTVVPVHACKKLAVESALTVIVLSAGAGFKEVTFIFLGEVASYRKHRRRFKRKKRCYFIKEESYHLYDRLGKHIRHEERYSIPRVPSVVELCIEAGVDLSDLPTKRRKPVIRIGKSEIIVANEDDLPDPTPKVPPEPLLTEMPDLEIASPSSPEETILLAEETLEAWEKMRNGAQRLMKKIPLLDDLIPPRYVWHVPNVEDPPLQRELRNFYGQAPAIVEMCVQGSAVAPEQYKSTMRLDIGIPSSISEVEKVFPRGSPMARDFSKAYLKLGIFNELDEYWFPPNPQSSPESAKA